MLYLRVYHGDRRLGETRHALYHCSLVINGFSQSVLHVCPYWNEEQHAICFREKDGEDLNLRFDAEMLSAPTLRPLGELAVAEGFVASLLGSCYPDSCPFVNFFWRVNRLEKYLSRSPPTYHSA